MMQTSRGYNPGSGRKTSPLSGSHVVNETAVCHANTAKKEGEYSSCGKQMVLKTGYSYICPLHGEMVG